MKSMVVLCQEDIDYNKFKRKNFKICCHKKLLSKKKLSPKNLGIVTKPQKSWHSKKKCLKKFLSQQFLPQKDLCHN